MLRKMKNKNMKRLFVLLLGIILVLSCCSCGKKTSFSIDSFDTHENTIERTYKFTEDENSEPVRYNKKRIHDFQKEIVNTKVAYDYDELFDYDKAMSGVFVNHNVTSHDYCALNQNGVLTTEHLFEIVRQNNTEYLKNMTSLLQDIDDEFLLRICEIIVNTTNDILEKYPDIDRNRVYCNLGNLKVLEKLSALDFAAVEPGMVLHVNRSTSNMVHLLTSSNMYSVLVHETMHILQFGCQCEKIKGCTRRFGFAHAYDDWEQDYANWTWLGEGSAERMACLYANVEPMTYQNMVNYILTMDLATVLRDDIPANYIETLYFYDDANRLFSLFDADTETKKKEIYQMIYSLEIMQVEPDDIKEAYHRIYGVEWTEEIRDEVNYKVKSSIVKTLTKVFFTNLSNAVIKSEVSKNDVMFLLNLYESTINYHLKLDSKNDSYNSEFIEWYKELQHSFFDNFGNLSQKEYVNYAASINENTINASMKWLDNDKREFLVEKFEANMCNYKLS